MHETKKVDLSIVVPVFDEELVLREFYNRLMRVIQSINKTYEIIFVDDGSRDNSSFILQELAKDNQDIVVIKFSRNFGHHIAITAGLDYANGDLVGVMDADLQDRPEEIPSLLAKINEGYDVVFAIHKNKPAPFFKRVSSFFFWLLINQLGSFPVPLSRSIFRIMRCKVAKNLNRCRERERFLVGMISYLGFRQIGVPVERDTRFAGKSKYSLSKMARLAVAAITSFSYLPLRLASIIGIFCIAVSSFLGLMLLLRHPFVFTIADGKILFLVMFFFTGLQFIFIGILGEYVGRIYSEAQNRPLYVVDYIING